MGRLSHGAFVRYEAFVPHGVFMRYEAFVRPRGVCWPPGACALRGVRGLTVTSAALLGESASANAPARAGMLWLGVGACQEPSAATARPASRTPPVALGEGAVRRMTRAARRPAPAFSRRASGREPGGSSSTSTTCTERSGPENEAATRLGEPSAVTVVGSGR